MKLKKRFKKFISILFGCSLAFSSCLAFTPSTNAILASALSSEEYSIYDYEWANYFNFNEVMETPYFSSTPIADRFNVSKTDDSIELSSKIAGDFSTISTMSYLYLYESTATGLALMPDLKSNTTYYFSFDIEGIDIFNIPRLYLVLEYPNSSGDWVEKKVTWKANEGFKFLYDSSSVGGCRISLMFSLKAYTQTIDTVITLSNFRVFEGSEDKAYSPYFYSLESINPDGTWTPGDTTTPDDSGDTSTSDDYERGYDIGYDKGYSDGLKNGDRNQYNNGYAEGLKYAKYSFFLDITLEVSVLNSSGSVTLVNAAYEPEYVAGGITLSPLIDYLEEEGYTSSNCSGVRLDFNFAYPIVLENLHFRLVGNTESFVNSFDVEFADETFKGKFRWFDEFEGYGFYTMMTEEQAKLYAEKTVYSFKNWDIPGLDNLQGVVCVDYENGFYSGYESGKATGLKEGESKGYSNGYNDGLVVGEGNGFAKGLAQGISEDPYGLGDFIYTVIDMPGRFLANLLNFEFLGVNLAGLVTAVLSLLIIIFVVKKVT